MATYETAMDRLRDELAKKTDHPGVATVGEYLTYRLQREPSLADKLAAEGKSIEGAFNAIQKYASEHRNGKTWIFVPPEKALEIACEYYVIPPENAQAQTLAQTPAPAPTDDGLDLDSLLGL